MGIKISESWYDKEGKEIRYSFHCPVCDKINMNYHELWYDGWKITGYKNTMILKCEKCEAELFFFTDEKGNGIYVRKKQEGDVEFISEE